jgi:hypothetical protein
MEPITYFQVQELVKRLPKDKLTDAYRLLVNLTSQEADNLSPQLMFLCLPRSEQRRLLAQQAERMKAHYEQTVEERLEWQAGDFVDEDSAW